MVLAKHFKLKKMLVAVYCAELEAIKSLKILLISLRKVFIVDCGRQTRCTATVCLGGLLAGFTSAVGQLT
jgi:hypothetical protein